MIITMKDGSRIDYGVFAVEHPFMDIIAIKSSDYHTPLSGDEPAFLVMGTATGEIYQTKDFVAVDESFAEFFITDQKLIETLLPKTSIYYNKILNVGIVGNDDGWSLFVEFDPRTARGTGTLCFSGASFRFLDNGRTACNRQECFMMEPGGDNHPATTKKGT